MFLTSVIGKTLHFFYDFFIILTIGGIWILYTFFYFAVEVKWIGGKCTYGMMFLWEGFIAKLFPRRIYFCDFGPGKINSETSYFVKNHHKNICNSWWWLFLSCCHFQRALFNYSPVTAKSIKILSDLLLVAWRYQMWLARPHFGQQTKRLIFHSDSNAKLNTISALS